MSSLLLAVHIACLLGSIAYLDSHVRGRVVELLRALGQTTIDRVSEAQRVLVSSPQSGTTPAAEVGSFSPPREDRTSTEPAIADPGECRRLDEDGSLSAKDDLTGAYVDETAGLPPLEAMDYYDSDYAEKFEEDTPDAFDDLEADADDEGEVGDPVQPPPTHSGGIVAINPSDYSQTRKPTDEGFRVANTRVLREVYVSPLYVREVTDIFVESELALYALQFSRDNAERLIRCTVMQDQSLPLTLSKPLM